MSPVIPLLRFGWVLVLGLLGLGSWHTARMLDSEDPACCSAPAPNVSQVTELGRVASLLLGLGAVLLLARLLARWPARHPSLPIAALLVVVGLGLYAIAASEWIRWHG